MEASKANRTSTKGICRFSGPCSKSARPRHELPKKPVAEADKEKGEKGEKGESEKAAKSTKLGAKPSLGRTGTVMQHI